MKLINNTVTPLKSSIDIFLNNFHEESKVNYSYFIRSLKRIRK